MDTTKQNQPNGAQDSSDDLIAELARLVAQDARSSSANSGAQQREAKPEASRQAAPQPASQSTAPSVAAPVNAQANTPAPGAAEREAEDVLPMFGLGEGGERSEPQNAPEYDSGSDDPIAQLISDAELDQMRFDAEADLQESAQPGDQSSAGSNVAPERKTSSASAFADISLDDDRWSPPQADRHGAEDKVSAQDTPETGDRDPLKDIEALIGEAARVSAGGDSAAGRRVRSSFLPEEPQPAQDPKLEAGVDAAESAILAATAASGVSAARLEEKQPQFDVQEPERASAGTEYVAAEPSAQPHYDEVGAAVYDDYAEDTDVPEENARRERRRPAFLIPAVAGAALFALIGGAYFTFFSGQPEPGEAPVLSAEGGPLREDAPQVANTSAASDSVVFNELSGSTTNAGEETLVSRDQTGGVTGGEVSRIITPEEGEMELANRPVRTVTVRPDGTIVNAEDSVAGSNVLPVDRPNVPEVPSSSLTSDPIGEAITLAMAGEGEGTAGDILAATGEAISSGTSLVSEASASEADATAEAGTGVAAAGTDGAETGDTAGVLDAPLPIPRPEGLSASIDSAAQTPAAATPATSAQASEPQTVASVDPSQSQPPAAAAGSENVAAWVQLSSQRSEETARAGIPELQSRYGALFNGAELDVSRVDLGDRGIYYRVRLPQPTLDDATSVCNAIRGQGGDCFVLNN